MDGFMVWGLRSGEGRGMFWPSASLGTTTVVSYTKHENPKPQTLNPEPRLFLVLDHHVEVKLHSSDVPNLQPSPQALDGRLWWSRGLRLRA